MDSNLFWVLVGTGALSFLTLVYVVLDESGKKRRYDQQKAQQPSPSPDLAETVRAAEAQEAPLSPPSPDSPEPIAPSPEGAASQPEQTAS
ncbi:MAG: hypothetical protein NW237_14930 [Cyanobacteriota bacterium]|nr:hypothetical protein [Cyanobacteriota bacterium]